MSKHNIPKGWISTKIGNIVRLINGRAFKPIEWSKQGLPIIRIQNLNNDKAEFNFCNFRVEDKYLIDNGTLLFAWSGTPGTSFGAHIWNKGKAILNQHIFKVEINNDYLDKYFLKYALNQNLNEYIFNAHGAAGLAHITKDKFENSFIQIPPLNEQKRIVSKIEELFSKLDAGIEYLKKSQILLKQYRQSVLKYAFEGKLTEKWREINKTKSPDKIIIDKLINLNKNYEEINQDSKVYEMNSFPTEWSWIRVSNITKKLQYGSSDKALGEIVGIPVLRMGNIIEGKLFYDNLKYYPRNWIHLDEFLLEEGDILFNRTNSAELVGKTAVYQRSVHPKVVFASYLIRIKILMDIYLPKLLSYFINSIYGRRYIKSAVSQQVGQANVNGKKLSNMPIPFIPFEEQFQIVKELDKLLSITENLEKTINQNMNYCKNMQKSILRTAFEGELVAQDPNDEPASMLVEKIKQEKLIETDKKNKSQYKQAKLI
jgi:type I restriction enzyme, S subunit